MKYDFPYCIFIYLFIYFGDLYHRLYLLGNLRKTERDREIKKQHILGRQGWNTISGKWCLIEFMNMPLQDICIYTCTDRE